MILQQNDLGGVTVANTMRISNEPEKRYDALVEIRQLLDALEEACLNQERSDEITAKALAMIEPGPKADELRKASLEMIEKLDALRAWQKHVTENVRSGTFKRMAELFDK
jgi:hypothetical protein